MSNPPKNPDDRLAELHALALASSSFNEMVVRIVAFRAYVLSMRDSGIPVPAAEGLDAELVEAFAAVDGNPAGLGAFLPD